MFTHPYHDVEVEPVSGDSPAHLIKILAQDGRRFTYRLVGPIDATAIAFLRRMIDGGVTSDLLIDRTEDSFRAEESPIPLPRHG